MKLETIPGKIDEFRLTYGKNPGKLIRRRRFHQDVWTVQVSGDGVVFFQEDFSTFEMAFTRAALLTQDEVDREEEQHSQMMADLGDDAPEEDVA